MGRSRIPDSVRQSHGLDPLRKVQVKIPDGVSLFDYVEMQSINGEFDRQRAFEAIQRYTKDVYGLSDDVQLVGGLLADELAHYFSLQKELAAEKVGSQQDFKLRRARSESLGNLLRLTRQLGLSPEARFTGSRQSEKDRAAAEVKAFMAGPVAFAEFKRSLGEHFE